MSLWDQVKASMSEWYGTAAERTEEMARIGVRKYDKLTLTRTLERTLTQLGSHVYAALRDGRTDLASDPQVRAAMARIRDLEEQLAHKEQEIAAIRAASAPQRAPASGAAPGQGPERPAGPSGPRAGGAALTVAGVPAVADDADQEPGPDLDPGPTPEREMVLDAWEDELAGYDALPEDAAPEREDRPGSGPDTPKGR